MIREEDENVNGENQKAGGEENEEEEKLEKGNESEKKEEGNDPNNKNQKASEKPKKIKERKPFAENDANDNKLSLTCFSRDTISLPNIQEAGTIIRVHRARIKMYKGNTQLNCDLHFRSSWSIYPLFPKSNIQKYSPSQISGKTSTFCFEDKERIDKMREEAITFFDKITKYGTTINLLEAEKKRKDFDTLVFILQIKDAKKKPETQKEKGDTDKSKDKPSNQQVN